MKNCPLCSSHFSLFLLPILLLLSCKGVEPCPPLEFSTEVLPEGEQGVEYSEGIELMGAVGEVTWTAYKEELPRGISFHGQGGIGTFSGIPSLEGDFSFNLIAADSCSEPRELSGTISLRIGRGWQGVLCLEDDRGDSISPSFDLKNLLVKDEEGVLKFRIEAWSIFPSNDLEFQIYLVEPEEEVYYILDYDDEDLDLFSWDGSSEERLGTPDSLKFETPEDGVMIVSVAREDVDVEGDLLYIQLYAGSAEDPEDFLFFSEELVPYSLLSPSVDVRVTELVLDDSEGDGDGILEPDENILITPVIRNYGYVPADTGFYTIFQIDDSSPAMGEILLSSNSALYGDEGIIESCGEYWPDTPLSLSISQDATPWEWFRIEGTAVDSSNGIYDFETGGVVISDLTGRIMEDPADSFSTFDGEGVSLYLDMEEGLLYFKVSSHFIPENDFEIDIWLDTDMDAATGGESMGEEYIISNFPFDGEGSIYGPCCQWELLDRFEGLTYYPDLDYILYRIPLDALGDPEGMNMAVYITDLDEGYTDLIPSGWYDGDSSPLFIFLYERPYLELAGLSNLEISGNGDLSMDGGEVWSLTPSVRNTGLSPALSVTGFLTSHSPLVTVTSGEVDFPDVDPGNTESSFSPFLVVFDQDAAGYYEFLFTATSTEGEWSDTFELGVSIGGSGGDTCDGAVDIGDGTVFAGSTLDSANNYRLDSSSCTLSSTPGPDVVYSILLSEGDYLSASLYSEFDSALYLVTDCTDVDASCVAGSDFYYGGTSEFIEYIAGEEGTFYLIVDGASYSDEGDYLLSVDHIVAPRNDTCSGTLPETGGGGSFTADTTLSADDYTVPATCSASRARGNDVVYLLTLTADSLLDVTLSSEEFDTILYIEEVCGDQDTIISCSDDVEEGSTDSAISHLPLVAGTYYLVVDGKRGYDYGNFTLEVEVELE